jgi:hypothetical protein
VLEKRHVVGGGLDAQHDAAFVIPNFRTVAHMTAAKPQKTAG